MKKMAPPWILRRYIGLEYARWLFFCIIAFVSLVVVVDLFENAGTFIKHKASTAAVFRYTVSELPQFTVYVIAPSLLIAMLVAVSGMARRNEITAILAGGIGRRSIVAPMALIALLFCAAQFSLAEYVVPDANAIHDYVLEVEINGADAAKFRNRRNHWFLADGGFLRVGVLDRRHADEAQNDLVLHDVLYLRAGVENQPPLRIEADSARWDSDANQWNLFDARRTTTDSSGLLRVVRSRTLPLALPLGPKDLVKNVPSDTDELGVAELRRVIHDRTRLGQSVVKETVDLYQRFAFPLAGFVMALLGVPFAFREHRRGGAATGILTGLVIAFSYYVVMATSLSFGKSGAVPPVLAAWLPVAIFGATGIYLASTLDML